MGKMLNAGHAAGLPANFAWDSPVVAVWNRCVFPERVINAAACATALIQIIEGCAYIYGDEHEGELLPMPI